MTKSPSLALRGPFTIAGAALSRIFQTHIETGLWFWSGDNHEKLSRAVWIYFRRLKAY